MKRLILASTSAARIEQLGRLRLPFEALPHGCQEILEPSLSPVEQITHIARRKAQNLASQHKDALIIGSDQGLFTAHGEMLGKPGSAARARAQLARLSGGVHELITAVALLDANTGRIDAEVEVHRMHFRTLTPDAIAHYVEADHPIGCAGSFKIESLGITLFDRIEGNDPTAIMGLPLLHLTRLLTRFGVAVLGS